MTIKILNLYAGIGGNRKLWAGDIEVTAIENNEEIAKIYQDFFPSDKVIIADAQEYLLNNYSEFNFIWASPPCKSHSHIRKELAVEIRGQSKPIYPDMTLYQIILFLQSYFKGKFVVENVCSYYEPLIKPQILGDHYFWSNCYLGNYVQKSKHILGTIDEMQKYKGFDLSRYKLRHRKDQLLRNCVHPKLGLHIFNMVFKTKQIKINEII